MVKLIIVEVINMANRTKAGTDIQEVKRQNAQSASKQSSGQYGTEFASETDVQEVKRQNAQSASKQSSGQYGTEFASETDVQEVKRQNAQSASNKYNK